MQKARVTLSSPDFKVLDSIANNIISVCERTGVKHSGVIPMPTKKIVVPTRKSPAGGGTESYEKWEMRVHKRLLDLGVDERALRLVMRVPIPEGLNIEIEMIE